MIMNILAGLLGLKNIFANTCRRYSTDTAIGLHGYQTRALLSYPNICSPEMHAYVHAVASAPLSMIVTRRNVAIHVS